LVRKYRCSIWRPWVSYTSVACNRTLVSCNRTLEFRAIVHFGLVQSYTWVSCNRTLEFRAIVHFGFVQSYTSVSCNRTLKFHAIIHLSFMHLYTWVSCNRKRQFRVIVHLSFMQSYNLVSCSRTTRFYAIVHFSFMQSLTTVCGWIAVAGRHFWSSIAFGPAEGLTSDPYTVSMHGAISPLPHVCHDLSLPCFHLYLPVWYCGGRGGLWERHLVQRSETVYGGTSVTSSKACCLEIPLCSVFVAIKYAHEIGCL
jgi:hypothetical protein